MLVSLMMASVWCAANNLGVADGYSGITVKEAKVQGSPRGSSIQASINGHLLDVDNAQMRIYNALGVSMAAYDLLGNETQKVLDLRDLASGVYTYTVCCGKHSQTGKLVIVK